MFMNAATEAYALHALIYMNEQQKSESFSLPTKLRQSKCQNYDWDANEFFCYLFDFLFQS